MKKRFCVFSQALLFGGMLATLPVYAQQSSSPDAAPATDNTKMNDRDRPADRMTADQQSENSADRDMTQQIRKALISDKSLSSYGHNVKIITVNGSVTLKGPVRSQEEKQLIESKAASVSGKAVKSELTVEPKS
jgi:hyperosmotically inducible protein